MKLYCRLQQEYFHIYSWRRMWGPPSFPVNWVLHLVISDQSSLLSIHTKFCQNSCFLVYNYSMMRFLAPAGDMVHHLHSQISYLEMESNDLFQFHQKTSPIISNPEYEFGWLSVYRGASSPFHLRFAYIHFRFMNFTNFAFHLFPFLAQYLIWWILCILQR